MVGDARNGLDDLCSRVCFVLERLSLVALGCVGAGISELDRGDLPDQEDDGPDADECREPNRQQQQQRLRARLAGRALWTAPLEQGECTALWGFGTHGREVARDAGGAAFAARPEAAGPVRASRACNDARVNPAI